LNREHAKEKEKKKSKLDDMLLLNRPVLHDLEERGDRKQNIYMATKEKRKRQGKKKKKKTRDRNAEIRNSPFHKKQPKAKLYSLTDKPIVSPQAQRLVGAHVRFVEIRAQIKGVALEHRGMSPQRAHRSG